MRSLILAFTGLLVLAPQARAEESVLDNGRRPLMWRMATRGPMDTATRKAVGAKFGAELESVENAVVDAGGIRLGVNVIRCSTEKDADVLEKAFLKMKGSPLYVLRRDRDVVELVTGNRLVAQKARDWIGWDSAEARTVTWNVGMTVAPLEHAPPMRWNRMFNALWAWRLKPGKETEARIRTEAKGFRFDNTAFFRTEKNSWGAPEYVFDAELENRGAWRFAALPRRLDIPFLNVEATIPVRAFAVRPTTAKPDRKRLCAGTEFWPVDDPVVKKAAAAAVPAGKKLTPRGLVEWILKWVQRNVRYDGDVMGSRWGVAKVLEQGFGHCWDKSDVFITLCRAHGIPARQVGGWVDQLSGHIWADVWISGEGWLEVDATASWLGTSTDYVPFWISEDGASPFIYWEKPEMKRQ
ncbi:MAG: transglutaminase-like domain-containing protein [Planctomycetota bacterium]|jgi:transglutaminase-like putative cysteine protease